MFKSTGKLRYSPKLNNGSMDRRDGGSTKWWLVIDVSPGIGRYYRDLFAMHRHNVELLQRPLWDAHISVVRDEEPKADFKALWNKYQGQPIEFFYDGFDATGNGTYVWLPVRCDRALDIREELGLPRMPYFNLHLTIGNLKEQ